MQTEARKDIDPLSIERWKQYLLIRKVFSLINNVYVNLLNATKHTLQHR